MTEHVTDEDLQMLNRAVALARAAGAAGNLPVGAVIACDGKIIAEGRNAIWKPCMDHTRHAEMEALRAVAAGHWPAAPRMTLYTTLEPCVMCFGAILLAGVGRVVFGAEEPWGGASCIRSSLPALFSRQYATMGWHGPALPEECNALLADAIALIRARELDGSIHDREKDR